MDLDNEKNKTTLLNRTTKEPLAIDARGDIRWYSTLWSQHIFEPWSNGHNMMLSKRKQSSNYYNDLIESDWLGRIYNEYSFSNKIGSTNANSKSATVIHHDLLRLPNGNILATVSDGSRYQQSVLAEISYKSGKAIKIIDFRKILPKSFWKNFKESKSTIAAPKYDWLHNNSVEYDQNDHSILTSNRNQDLIMKLDYKTKKIKWLYSGKKKTAWPKKYQKYVLTPVKGTKIPGAQHGLNLLNDINHNPNQEKILLYDNNVNVTNGNKKTSKKYSQAVQYYIDVKNKKIKQTWSYGKSLGKKNFTDVIGFAQRLNNGNTLIDFGFKQRGKESNVIEVTPDKKQVFNATIKNKASKTYTYRVYRLPLYNKNYIFDATI